MTGEQTNMFLGQLTGHIKHVLNQGYNIIYMYILCVSMLEYNSYFMCTLNFYTPSYYVMTICKAYSFTVIFITELGASADEYNELPYIAMSSAIARFQLHAEDFLFCSYQKVQGWQNCNQQHC